MALFTNMTSIGSTCEYIDSSEKFTTIPTIQTDAYQFLKEASRVNSLVKTRFIFVRHGETPTNKQGGLPGSRTSNDPLTEDGQKQAKVCGEKLLEIGMTFDGFFRSPTLRTEQTLEIIQRELHVSENPILDERLHEKYHGKYEEYVNLSSEELHKLKMARQQIKEREISENTGCQKTFEEKFNYSPEPEHLESLAQIAKRVNEFIIQTAQSEKNQGCLETKNFLVVSHYGVLKTLFMQDAYLRGYDIDYRAHDVKNCGVVVLEVDAEGIHVKATEGFTFKTH